MTATASDVQAALRDRADPDRAAHARRYFKTGHGEYGEGDEFLGISMPDARRVARRHRDLPLPESVALLASPVHEDRMTALVILVAQHRRGDAAARAAIHSAYLARTARVNNWDLVDVSAPEIVGEHLRGGSHGLLDELARSPSVWERRIAIIATLAFIKAGELDDTFRLSLALADDPHDLIHKACGWMLREAGKVDEGRLVAFLAEHHEQLPRTTIRYACERLAPDLRPPRRR
jgi:3-methyladenine DNA glycosylase AlkD